MWQIPTILSANELLDKAFKRVGKVSIIEQNPKLRAQRESIAKIQILVDVLSSKLEKYVKAFPSLDRLPKFYSELIDLMIDIDVLKQSLATVYGCRRHISRIGRESIRKISRAGSVILIERERKAAYGRISSILRGIDPSLRFLASARAQIKELPSVDTDIPTIVIAGAPNVGKSMLVRALSSAKPKVASYPFTTLQISVGHFEHEYRRYQVIDTPGLLDRDLEKRNEIEQRAVLALRHLAHVIVFLIDPTGGCGYSEEYQERLLDRINASFSQPIIVVEGKADLKRLPTNRLKVSGKTLDGVEELRRLAISLSPL